MIKIRLHGTLEEIKETTKIIREQFDVLSESEPYADRGKSKYYRCYMDCEVVFNTKVSSFKLQDSKKFNTVHYQTINGKPDCRRAGLPIMTRRNKIWVEPGDNHSLVIGTTNSGKTYSTIMIFIMTVLMADTSAFINDIKGELTPQFAPLFKARGYNVVVLNFVDSRKSECWNPFGTVYKAYRAEQARTVDNPSAWKTINDMNAYKQAKVNALKALQNTIRVYEQAKRLGERTSDIVAKLQNATENMRKKMQAVWNIEDSDGFPQPDFSDANIKLEDICRMLCEDTNAKDPHWWQSAKSLTRREQEIPHFYKWWDELRLTRRFLDFRILLYYNVFTNQSYLMERI